MLTTKDKPTKTKLLRRPRAPPVAPQPPVSPPPKSRMSIRSPTYVPSYMHYEAARTSPSLHTNIISPPPPSEFYSNSLPSRHTNHSVIRSTDLKYMLDPLIREKTQLGTYVEGQNLIKPYKPRGPDGLPARPARSNPPIIHDMLDDDASYVSPPAFSLQDFIISVSEVHRIPLAKVQKAVLSKHNYKKIQKMIADDMFSLKTNKVHKQEMRPSDDMPKVTPRVPQKQLLIEMAGLVKEQMSDATGVTMKSVIRSLPKYRPGYHKDLLNPHTEILLYEDSSQMQLDRLLDLRKHTELPGKNNLFHGSTAKYFQGLRRSDSPFLYPEEEEITASELAVLDSLVNGGTTLTLKANFVSMLPDIATLRNTLTYINLSFNDFRYVPSEIFGLKQLQVLKMRNNPLREIPEEIAELVNLRILVFSFCLVSSLPLGLFSLTELHHLDMSYNRLSSLPPEIKNLLSLKELNIEGNQLAAMPWGALCLNIAYLRVRNNFMHPLFWKENSQNEPQRLVDLAALAVNRSDITENIPEEISALLDNHSSCETCSGFMYGPGLLTIRPVARIFGIKNLPFLFHSCCASCRETFLTNTDSVSDLLFGAS